MIEQSDPEVHPLSAIAIPFAPPDKRRAAKDHRPTEIPGFNLDPSAIEAPALVLDRGLRIVWQNEAARSRIWQIRAEAVTHRNTPPSLFDLLFDARFQSKVDNWRQWVAFFLRQALTFLSQTELRQLIEAREGRQGECLQALCNGLDVAGSSAGASADQLRQALSDGCVVQYAVLGTTFGERRLMVFEATDGGSAAPLHTRLAWLRQQPNPVRVPMCILAARLDKADVLQDELLDEVFAQLVDGILQMAMGLLAEHGALFHQHSGASFQGIFLPTAPSEPLRPLDAISCALEFKQRMADLTREWKIRLGWRHQLRLNLGLHADEGFLRFCNSACGENWMVLGDTQRTAMMLAGLAEEGHIWATKPLIRRLSNKDLQAFRFGVHQAGGDARSFVPRGFTRISDLEPAPCAKHLPPPMGTEIVTRIMERYG